MCQKINCLIVFLLLLSSSSFAGNLIKGSGFEQWNENHECPAGANWRWEKNHGNKDLRNIKIGQSSTEKHSGKFSLHLADESTASANNGLYWQMSGSEVVNARGKKFRLKAWIKQLRSSMKQGVSISIWIRSEGGKVLTKKSGPDIEGETNWAIYQVDFKVPDDAIALRVILNCSFGWGATAEGYFDDLSLEEVIEKKQVKNRALLNTPKDSEGYRLYFFNDKLVPFWTKNQWGGIYIEKSASSAFSGSDGLRIQTVRDAKAWSGFSLINDQINKVADTSVFVPSKSFLEFKMRCDIPLQIALRNGEKTYKIPLLEEYFTPLKSDWKKVRIPLYKFTDGIKLATINGIVFQVKREMKKNEMIEIDEISLFTSDTIDPPKYSKGSPETIEFLKSIHSGKDVYARDNYRRPEIRNGTFYSNGKPVFMFGPWCSSGSLAIEWTENAYRDILKGPVYETPFSDEISEILGMNSMQLSAAEILPAIEKSDASYSLKDINASKAMTKFLDNLKGMPFVMDFAWGNRIPHRLSKDGSFPKEAHQHNPDWHQFIPMCPEHPAGDKIYSDYYVTGTQFTLENGGNPFVYEIFNESSYNCRCRYNREMFQQHCKTEYGDIAKANQVWGTNLNSFDEIAKVPFYEKLPGLWIEWCKFSGTRYASILEKYKNLIRSVDKRDRVYFTEQNSITNLLKYRGAGMDYLKIADSLDILGAEGGRAFGRKLSFQNSKGNAMEDALSTHGEPYSFTLDLYTALVQSKKPILNNEHYCGRYLFGKRVPTKKEDIVTTLWNEVFHGASGSYFYAWNKRAWEWKTLEEAKATVINGGYKAYNLLNPYSYTRESLDGFKQFSDEIDKVAEIALPMPRLKEAKVGFLYSYPTLRMSTISNLDVEKRIGSYYTSLLYSQYPMEVVMEEDLSLEKISYLDAIVLPFITNSYPDTLSVLTEYVRKGGVVICSPGSFVQNEYGKLLDAGEFLGLSYETASDKKGTCQVMNIQLGSSTLFKGYSNVYINSVGNGKVFYIADELPLKKLKSIIPSILKDSKVNKYVEVKAYDGTKLEKVECQVIDRKDNKLLFLVNWEDKGSRLIDLKLNLENVQNFYLVDLFDKTLFLNSNGGEVWDTNSLKMGLPIVLNPQKRLVLLLTRNKPLDIDDKRSFEETRSNYDNFVKDEAVELKTIDQKELELQQSHFEARRYKEVNHKKCVSVDIRPFVNMAFKDETDGDRKGGWFDQGGNDFRNMPLGKQVFANVPFDIIDPAENKGKSAMILYGPARDYFPEKIEDIAVNEKAENIYFLHGVGWGIAKGELSHSYYVHYKDGTKVEIPVRYCESVGGWWKPKALPNAKIAVESSNLMSGHIGLYCYKWKNPHPEKEIETMSIIASKNNVVPAVVAVTLEQE